MKHKQCSKNEIQGGLAKVEAGTAVGDVARLSGVSKATIHRWQARYGGMTKDDAKRVPQLEEEHRRRKTLVADLALDNSILKAVGPGRRQRPAGQWTALPNPERRGRRHPGVGAQRCLDVDPWQHRIASAGRRDPGTRQATGAADRQRAGVHEPGTGSVGVYPGPHPLVH